MTKKQDAINQELAAFPVGAVVKLGGRKAKVVAAYPADDHRDYGLVIAEAYERGLVPVTTCFRVTDEGPELRVPEGWKGKKTGA